MPQRGRKSWLLPTLSLYDLNWEKSIQISITRGLNAKIKAGGDAGTAIILSRPLCFDRNDGEPRLGSMHGNDKPNAASELMLSLGVGEHGVGAN